MKRTSNKSWRGLVYPAAAALGLGSGSAMALNTGTDMNLAYKPASGGMAGAAYTRPQDISSALFGNPATLTQFSGGSVSLGASFMQPELDVTHRNGDFSNTSTSRADEYIVPDFALGFELMPGTVLGLGVELDAGIGTDFREDKITAGPDGVIRLPLNVELLSFNANLGLAHRLNDKWSIGGALTVGFGLAQLGTIGNTEGIDAALGGLGLADFGGTSSSTHDIGVGASLGATYQPIPALTLSGAVKSPLEYRFESILSTTVTGAETYQDLKVEQPLEIVLGSAYTIDDRWLLELDAVWKNWESAEAYKDVYKDQILLLAGMQFGSGPWTWRAGYSYASEPLREEPRGTLGSLVGLGTLPLDAAVPEIDLERNGLSKVVQMTLIPVITRHTFTAGLGYEFAAGKRMDLWAAYALEEEDDRDVGSVFGSYEAQFSQWAVGTGVELRF